MPFLRVLLLAAATSNVGAISLATEPWGYLYFFRTQKLAPLVLDEITIGRLTESDVVLTEPRVSRRHAVVRRRGEDIEIEDVGSSNGTKRNGELLRARSAVPLEPGDNQLAEEVALTTGLPGSGATGSATACRESSLGRLCPRTRRRLSDARDRLRDRRR
jgi:hypothetical protein